MARSRQIYRTKGYKHMTKNELLDVLIKYIRRKATHNPDCYLIGCICGLKKVRQMIREYEKDV
jgi:hypothetical protein